LPEGGMFHRQQRFGHTVAIDIASDESRKSRPV
jgi:hypothetical protein